MNGLWNKLTTPTKSLYTTVTEIVGNVVDVSPKTDKIVETTYNDGDDSTKKKVKTVSTTSPAYGDGGDSATKKQVTVDSKSPVAKAKTSSIVEEADKKAGRMYALKGGRRVYKKRKKQISYDTWTRRQRIKQENSLRREGSLSPVADLNSKTQAANESYLNKVIMIVGGANVGLKGKVMEIGNRAWWTIDHPKMEGKKVHGRQCRLLSSIAASDVQLYEAKAMDREEKSLALSAAIKSKIEAATTLYLNKRVIIIAGVHVGLKGKVTKIEDRKWTIDNPRLEGKKVAGNHCRLESSMTAFHAQQYEAKAVFLQDKLDYYDSLLSNLEDEKNSRFSKDRSPRQSKGVEMKRKNNSNSTKSKDLSRFLPKERRSSEINNSVSNLIWNADRGEGYKKSRGKITTKIRRSKRTPKPILLPPTTQDRNRDSIETTKSKRKRLKTKFQDSDDHSMTITQSNRNRFKAKVQESKRKRLKAKVQDNDNNSNKITESRRKQLKPKVQDSDCMYVYAKEERLQSKTVQDSKLKANEHALSTSDSILSEYDHKKNREVENDAFSTSNDNASSTSDLTVYEYDHKNNKDVENDAFSTSNDNVSSTFNSILSKYDHKNNRVVDIDAFSTSNDDESSTSSSIISEYNHKNSREVENDAVSKSNDLSTPKIPNTWVDGDGFGHL